MLILIDNGKIVFNESKAELLERHALLKGDNRLINEHSTKLFLRLRQTPFGFQGITNKVDQVCEQMKDIIIERPSIEDVMLAYVKER